MSRNIMIISLLLVLAVPSWADKEKASKLGTVFSMLQANFWTNHWFFIGMARMFHDKGYSPKEMETLLPTSGVFLAKATIPEKKLEKFATGSDLKVFIGFDGCIESIVHEHDALEVYGASGKQEDYDKFMSLAQKANQALAAMDAAPQNPSDRMEAASLTTVYTLTGPTLWAHYFNVGLVYNGFNKNVYGAKEVRTYIESQTGLEENWGHQMALLLAEVTATDHEKMNTYLDYLSGVQSLGEALEKYADQPNQENLNQFHTLMTEVNKEMATFADDEKKP